ncbi:GNAT family N-acetyltransferase [Virgibacillus doumboii]|uniref:GNAT family N-acetyltransferase n=1 Tax=Virgibacillus doumboii TaxID=2697503 RepID=UPI0013DEEB78|nr:GNAT family N-acetyltransferase [Virgibacillus doumboii]
MENEAIFAAVPILETKHYTLRGLTEDDAGELFQFMSDRETMKYITPDPVKTKDELKEEVQTQLDNFTNRKEIPWAVEHNRNGDLVGKISLHKLSIWHKKAELGVVIRNEYQNQGVMTEVLDEILAFGFNTLGLNRIVGDIFAENKGSEKLLRNFGFTKEGILRQTDFDGVRYHDTVVLFVVKTGI